MAPYIGAEIETPKASRSRGRVIGMERGHRCPPPSRLGGLRCVVLLPQRGPGLGPRPLKTPLATPMTFASEVGVVGYRGAYINNELSSDQFGPYRRWFAGQMKTNDEIGLEPGGQFLA